MKVPLSLSSAVSRGVLCISSGRIVSRSTCSRYLGTVECSKFRSHCTMEIDVAHVRSDMLDLTTVQFNNAGDSPMPRPVLERVNAHLDLEARVGGYEAAARVENELQEVYVSAADIINADSQDIALQESASMAWAKAFYAVAKGLRPGDRILTGMAEYAANYVAMLQVCRSTGARVETIPSDAQGELDLLAMEAMLGKGGVKLVAITHVPSNGGVVNPASEVGDLCRKHGDILYLLDSCQSIGQMDVDVKRIGCHMLCATGRKYIRGPRGTGFLYVSKAALDRIGEPPIIDHFGAPWVGGGKGYELRADARRFEFWESSIASRLGLGVALRYAMSIGIVAIEDRVRGLAGALRGALVDELGGHGVKVLDLGSPERRCGIVSFVVEGMEAGAVKEGMRLAGVYLSTSAANSTPLDATERELPTVVRASVHYFNELHEIDRFISALREVVTARRK